MIGRFPTSVWLHLKRGFCTTAERNGDKYREVREKIIANTVISRDHLTPEISLRLITPDCKIFHSPVHDEDKNTFDNDPFWAFYWPGGQALSRFILDTPSIVKDRCVLDVGSGSGACTIAAKISGSSKAVANDIDNVAAVAALLNADLNQTTIETCSDNLIGNPCDNYDVILVGDVFYDSDIAKEMLLWLKVLSTKGKEIYIGDPGRHGLNKQAVNVLQKIMTYELPENCCIENNGYKYAYVWKMRQV